MAKLTNLAPYLCISTMPLRSAMERIEKLPRFKFQIVTDEESRFLGTLTDGDIRRALLRGATIESAVSAAMQKEAVAGRWEIRLGIEHVRKLRQDITFLPIVDADRLVREIVVTPQNTGGIVSAVVMAGGLGTRLGERTRHTPKPLLPVQGGQS